MPNSDLSPSLLFKINENQLALEAASWSFRTGLSGAAEVADNVRGALDTIDKNGELIKLTLAVLMTSSFCDLPEAVIRPVVLSPFSHAPSSTSA